LSFSGQVLRPVRVASGNAPSGGEGVSGVSRDHVTPAELATAGYFLSITKPVEPYADMYRAAVLLRPGPEGVREEYAVWAASESSLSVLDSPAFEVSGGGDLVLPASGSLSVGAFQDGTSTFFVSDSAGRDLAGVTSLILRRGDTQALVSATFQSQDPPTGRVEVGAATLSALGGGFSPERGDSVVSVAYRLSPPSFWWSKNDEITRFGWVGSQGRWVPLKGSLPQRLGPVSDPEELYELSPPPSRFLVGEVLPGTSSAPDEFALLRVGLRPGAEAPPLDVLVVPDSALESPSWQSPAWDSYDGVVGERSGLLLLNPNPGAFFETYRGQILWYNPESFQPDADGFLGRVSDFPLDSTLGFPCLSPIPGTEERPFLRIGPRRYLTPIPVDGDAGLPLPTAIPEGTFYWSRSTGTVVLSATDIRKAVPGTFDYDIAYLGESLYYDGVACCAQPVPTQRAQPCLDGSGAPLVGTSAGGAGIPAKGDIFVPRARSLPLPGASGVLFVPDGSGDFPNLSQAPETRPNGSGLRRELAALGDSFFFTGNRAFEESKFEEWEVDLPRLSLKMKDSLATAALLASPSAPNGIESRVQIRRRGSVGQALYFTQGQVTLSTYSNEARLLSRVADRFYLSGNEILRFAIDNNEYVWDASVSFGGGGVFSPQQIANDLQLTIMAGAGIGGARVIRGRIALEAPDLENGSVEIGWNTSPSSEEDLSGCAALGFLPGWRVQAPGGDFRWQPDTGASVGLFRSPENLDGTANVPDFRARGQFRGEVLTNNLPGTPFWSVSPAPLVDLPGWGVGEHFQVALGKNIVRLRNWGVTQGVGLKYDFEQGRIIWTEVGQSPVTGIPSLTNTLQLPDSLVFPETLSSDAMAPTGDGFGLYLKEVGDPGFGELIEGVDFLLPGGGSPGQVLLISPEGALIFEGGGGTLGVGGTFSNPTLSPNSVQNALLQAELLNQVQVGYWLEVLTGPEESRGFYQVTAKSGPSPFTALTVTPEFPATGDGVVWKIFEGQEADSFDPTLVADLQQVPTHHFSEEPWKIRVLSSIGSVGGPLTAIVRDALASERPVSVRIGLAQNPSISLDATYLEQGLSVGLLSTNLALPPQVLQDPHYVLSSPGDARFSLRLGATLLSDMEVVAAFSPTVPPGRVEVGVFGSPIQGLLKFAADLLLEERQEVLYDQTFLGPALLTAGECEIDPTTGQVQLAGADIAQYSGQTAYLVEEMREEDVQISPLSGSFLLQKPLRAGQFVETAYRQADTRGDPLPGEVVEYLPLTVRLEQAARVDEFLYEFNPTGRTLAARGSEFVWVGVELQNFAGRVGATVRDDSTIEFSSPVGASEVVKINYAVLEAFGGEQSYGVSRPPVFRKPLLLEAGATSFFLEGDRTGQVSVGQLGLLGPVAFYVQAVSYSQGTQKTEVQIWPPPLTEAGSRAPGKEEALSLSSSPIAITIDPDGAAIPGGGPLGFWFGVSSAQNPLIAADRGELEFVFEGDLVRFASQGHLLEVDGYPHLILGSVLGEGGRYTTISVSNPAARNFGPSSSVRISVRPVYAPRPFNFEGPSPFLASEEYRLFLTDGSGPGQLLTRGVDYEADPASGGVSLKSPLRPGEKLFALYTGLQTISPVAEGGALLLPYWRAKYLRITTPSKENRLLGSALQARYRYAAPDAFYFETLPLEDYLAEVARIAVARASPPRSGGFPIAFPGESQPRAFGALGLRGEVEDLKDQDRAARAFIELYDSIVVAFEQVLENLSGGVIGDRSGKFRFFVGRDRKYAPPGWEDEITGDLVPRLIWREIVEEWADEALLAGAWVEEKDPVVDPTTAFEDDPSGETPGRVGGKVPDPAGLRRFSDLQLLRIANDMDDRVLVGLGRPRGLSTLLPSLRVPGQFRAMWEAHRYSRLYPEKSRHFSRLLPGVGAETNSQGEITDPGFFTPGRRGIAPGEEEPSILRTLGSTIGSVSNPVLGKIEKLTEVTAAPREARARIWRYYPEGDVGLDEALSLGGAAIGRALIVATPLSLSEFPLANGYPDATQLLSQGGDLIDLESGNPDLSTPAFRVGDRLRFGLPRGQAFDLTDSSGDGIFVGAILAGCVCLLSDISGNLVTGTDVLLNGERALQDFVSEGTGFGDTLFVGVATPALADLPGEGDSPTVQQLGELARAIPDYRIQFDLKVAKGTGEFIDASLWDREDAFPLPLRRVFGQKPPPPLSTIEGEVEFSNTSLSPLKIPALRGEALDDSGDQTIPYLGAGRGELAVLSEVAASIQTLLGANTPYPLPYSPSGGGASEQQNWPAVYPDERLARDGEVWQFSTGGAPAPAPPWRDPASLYTEQILRPVESGNPGAGLGDLRPFDLLLVETDQPLVSSGDLFEGMTGLLSVGEVSSNLASGPDYLYRVEPPRFVTLTPLGSVHHYTIANAFGWVSGTFPATSGVQPTEVVGPPLSLTLDFSSVSSVLLSRQAGALDGGLLQLLATPGNAILINFFDPDPGAPSGGAYLGSIILPDVTPGATFWVWDALNSVSTPLLLAAAGSGAYLAADNVLVIEPSASILGLIPGVSSGLYYDFTISIDTEIDANTAAKSGLLLGSAPGSSSCEVERNRLTFAERVSFRSALPRGSQPANGDPVEMGAELSLYRVSHPTATWLTVNGPSEINGGFPLTFLARRGPTPDGDPTVPPGAEWVGTFVEGALGSERGILKAMAWEGHGNTPLPFGTSPTQGIRFSGCPSSDLYDLPASGAAIEPILEATGRMVDAVGSGTVIVQGPQPWIQEITLGTGSLQNPVAGDLVVVDRGALVGGEATTKCGTYAVRHVVEQNATNALGQGVLALAPSSDAGSRKFLDLSFPTVQAQDFPSLSITLGGVPSLPSSPTGHGFEDPSTGVVFLYLILKGQYAAYDSSGPSYSVDPGSVYRMRVSAIASWSPGSGTLELTMDPSGPIEDALGGGLTPAEFFAAARSGVRVSGMVRFPVRPRSGLPENNVVGSEEDSSGNELTAGFFSVIAGNLNPANHGSASVTSEAWSKLSPNEIERLLNPTDAPSSPGGLGVRVPEPLAANQFYADRATPVYARSWDGAGTPDNWIRGVPDFLTFEEVTDAQWNRIHFDESLIAPGAHRLRCLLPGDRILLGDNLDPSLSAPGFWALSGIFFEPSFPKPTRDLASSEPRVVDQAHGSLPQTEIGVREISAFSSSLTTVEEVHFTVRRIRRWHDVQAEVAGSFESLKYLYEMRKGSFEDGVDGSYNPATRLFGAGTLQFGAPCNLGNLNDPAVNITAGDTLRLLGAGGELVGSAEIERVAGAGTLQLRRPGLSAAAVAAARSFQVWIKQAPVPHEQSGEQLLLLATQPVFQRSVDYGAGDTQGGRVPTWDTLQDNSVPDWSALGVQVGDWIVVDPAGPLYVTGEKGGGPLGDVSEGSRLSFAPGSPAPLDDNRGFYRVAASQGADLVVDGSSRFGGKDLGGTDNVVFGDAGAEYTVLPTVSASALTGNTEGQAALRPTAGPPTPGGAYSARVGLDAAKSIAPFGYRVVRPSPPFSQDALELVLFMRERMLSWIELVRSQYEENRGGDYWVFQEENHMSQLGERGIVLNQEVESLEGLVGVTPFANTSTCLSVLDRRFWGLDLRLDAAGYSQFSPDDSLDQRPVLPDLIEDALDREDRFRDLRFSWVRFRADRVSGSIQAAKRAEESLPEEEQKQKELVAQRKSLGEG
jgi:hypothetical protein